MSPSARNIHQQTPLSAITPQASHRKHTTQLQKTMNNMSNTTSEKTLLDVETGIPQRSNSGTILSRIQSIAPDLASTTNLLIYTTLQHVTLRKQHVTLTIQPSALNIIFWLLSTRIGYLILGMLEGKVACETGRQQAVFYGTFVSLGFIVSAIGVMLSEVAVNIYA